MTRAAQAASSGGPRFRAAMAPRQRRPPTPIGKTRRRSAAAVLSIALALLSARASATTVVAKDFAALCTEADLIFVGTVTSVESRWADASQAAIETLVTFDTPTWLRGMPRPSVTLRFAGGEMDGLREEIAGVPRFALGEQRVIFAHEGRFVSPIVGFDQGAMRVVGGPDGAIVVGMEATSDGRGALRLGTPGGTETAPVPLDRFLDRVRRQLDAAGGGPP